MNEWLKERTNLSVSTTFYPYKKVANILREKIIDKTAAEEYNAEIKKKRLHLFLRFLYPDLPIYYKYGSYCLFIEDPITAKKCGQWMSFEDSSYNLLVLFFAIKYGVTSLKDEQ